MKKKLIAFYILLVAGISFCDLILDTVFPFKLMDVAFSVFKGVCIGSILMVLVLVSYYAYITLSSFKKNNNDTRHN